MKLLRSIFFSGFDLSDLVTEEPSFPFRAAAALAMDAYKNACTLMSTPFPSLTLTQQNEKRESARSSRRMGFLLDFGHRMQSYQASPTPPTIGINMAYASIGLTSIGGINNPTTAAKAGSQALTIWAKDTAPTAEARTEPA